MAEGFFTPHRLGVPGVSADRLCASMVRILPKTLLVLDIAADADEIRNRGRNEAQPDGSETWYRFFTREDFAKVDDPGFAMGMVRHEFSRLVKAGATFPATVPLDGGGSGFSISRDGHVLTNFHLVVAEVSNNNRDEGVVNCEVLCKSLRAQTASRQDDGTWQWQDANAVWLVSNASFARALEADDTGLLHPREDTALLRVDPQPSACLTLSDRVLDVSESVWMAGFPLRSARRPADLQRIGYSDADGSLRVSAGQVRETDADRYFTADLDGSMGNSGSAVFDRNGLVVGMFSRAVGSGERNATEYGHVNRVQVTARTAVRGLALDQVLPRTG